MRTRTSPRSSSVVVLALALAFGGGLWLHVLHTLEGATEHNEPPGLVHWLRDSTLALPLMMFAAWLGLLLAERLIDRVGRWSTRVPTDVLAPGCVAVVASASLAAASPVHGLLFDAHHGNDTSQLAGILHVLRDGELALLVNLAIACAVYALLARRRAPQAAWNWGGTRGRVGVVSMLAVVGAAVVPLASTGIADQQPTNCAPLPGAPFTALPNVTLPQTVPEDTFNLSDCPGNWFRSNANGTPVTSVPVGGKVDFVAGVLTQTRHTATLAAKPPTSQLVVDQDDSHEGGIASAQFDQPGLYLFLCKVHPYMNGIVLVPGPDANVNVDVPAAEFPFIQHLPAAPQALPASAVLAVLPTIAPSDAEKAQKWDISNGADTFAPAIPGVGEVWIDTQFEAVPGQVDDRGVDKPGTITVVKAGVTPDAPSTHPGVAPYTIEKKIDGVKDPVARFRWDNPHNMWVDAPIRIVYNGHWFGRWHNKIDRATGTVLTTIEVGHAPTHTVTNPNQSSPQEGILSLPLSALQDFLKLKDPGGFLEQFIIQKEPTGVGLNHPHAQWVTSDGKMIVFPNVFKGFGFDGSIGVVDFESGQLIAEFRGPNIKAPVATGIQGVTQGNKAYVANIVSGTVSVIDLNTMQHTKDIHVTLTPDCQPVGDVFETLQAPIQTPVSPNGRFVATAVLSLTTVPRLAGGPFCTGFPDHVAIIDTAIDEVVAYVGVPSRPGTAAGAHGSQWGAKQGGGYYANIANQSSNTFTIIDPDPAGTGTGFAAKVVGRVLLAGCSVVVPPPTPATCEGGPHVTDGTGGQGIEPLPPVYDGWIQEHVAHAAEADAEVQGWLAALTACQKDPKACPVSGPGR